MKLYQVWLSCALVALSFATARANEPARTQDVDLVICLDVSNSMDGLIASAKQKLWDIVNTLARAEPTPKLRVALYSYGNDTYDAKIGWVRKELDFTSDLDAVFKKLFDLTTRGGTEYVARVCRDALRDLDWSSQANALKLIFVCGNEPATQDPTLRLAEIAALASAKGVLINSIYCGSANHGDAQGWRELAELARGKFANIDQGQKAAVATPFDKKLADLAESVNATYVPYGARGAERLNFQVEQSKNSAGLGAANLAARVVTQNTQLYRQEGWDLIDRMKKDKDFDLSKVPTGELPEKMRKMSPEERVRYLGEVRAKREAIQKQVEELARQRQDYLREDAKKNAATTQRRFDAVLEQTIRSQAADKKIHIPE